MARHSSAGLWRTILPSGTLVIWKKRTAVETGEPAFLVYFLTEHRRPEGTLTLNTSDDLRTLLTDLGIVGAVQEKTIEDVWRFTMTLVRDVELTQAFIDQNRL